MGHKKQDVLTVEDPTAKTTISVIEVTVMATPAQYTLGSKPFSEFATSPIQFQINTKI